jgi:ribose transport system substrate-binding protein
MRGDEFYRGYILKIHIFLFSLFLFLPVARAENTKRSPFRVGVLYWSMNIPGQRAMRKGLEDEVANFNRKAAKTNTRSVRLEAFVAGDGQEGMEKQIRQFRHLIGEKPDAIIVQPTDNAALSEPLLDANKAGIPVVAYDQYISGGELASYVTSDNYQAGYLDGEYTAYHFDKNREIRIILVEYPHVSSTVERVDGFLDGLKDNGQKFKILKTYIAVEPISGATAGRKILLDFPEKNSFDVLFTVNDGGGLFVVRELEKAKRFEVFAATIDGDSESVEIIKRGGIIKIDSAQFCGAMGREAFRLTIRILKGKKIPEHVLIPAFPVTRETLKMYKDWLKPLPGDFEKPWESTRAVWSSKFRIVKH